MEPQLQFWMFQEPFKLLDINEAITRGIYLQNKSAKIHSCCLVISLTITKPSTSSDFMFVECISCQTWALRRPSRGNRPAGIRWRPVADTWPAFSTFPVRWVHHRPHSLHPKHMLQKIGGKFRKSSRKNVNWQKQRKCYTWLVTWVCHFFLSPVLPLPHCWSTFFDNIGEKPSSTSNLPYTHRCTVLSRVACATFMVLCTNTAFTTLSTSSWTMSGADERRDLQPVQFAKRTMGLYQHRRQIAKTVILCYRTV